MTDANALARRWTDMWNSLIAADEVVAPDCRVYFGRTPVTDRPTTTRGPAELQAVVDGIRARAPGIAYGFDGRVLQQMLPEGGIVTLLWRVDPPGAARRTGIDLLRHDEAGRVVEVWSVTGDLSLPPIG